MTYLDTYKSRDTSFTLFVPRLHRISKRIGYWPITAKKRNCRFPKMYFRYTSHTRTRTHTQAHRTKNTFHVFFFSISVSPLSSF